MTLADQYDGVYRDLTDGSFVEIVDADDGRENSVGLAVPGKDDPYYVFSETGEELVNELDSDFEPVPDDAVENPAEFVKEMLDLAEGGEALSLQAQDGLAYAREHVEIVESEH